MTQTYAYSTQNNALNPPTEWVLADNGIRMSNKAVDSLIAWTDIREIRLQYAPTRYIANRYTCEINLHSGGSVWFSSHRVAGLLDSEDHGAEYDRFVRKLLQRTIAHNPECRLVSGAGILSYTSKLLVTVFAAWMLYVLFKLSMAFGLTWLAVVKLTVAAFLAPRLLRWLRVSRGATFSLYNIPPGVLPSRLAPISHDR